VRTDVAGATEGQRAKTIVKEEEKILRYVTIEDRPVELLTQWEMDLKALEDWLDSLELEGGCHNIYMPKETHQHQEQLV
jgi:hypothetical protein